MRNLFATLLLSSIVLCTGVDASALPGGEVRFGGSNVTVRVDATGLSLDLMRAVQATNQQVATNSWKSGGKTVTVSTPRKEFPTHIESNKDWAKRHKDAVDAFEALFPPDTNQASVSGGDAVGVIPLSQPSPSSGEVVIAWKSGSHDVKVAATPYLHESAAQFAYRVGAAVKALEDRFPPN